MREYGFSLTVFYRIRAESVMLSLNGRIRVSENPYFLMIYTVESRLRVLLF